MIPQDLKYTKSHEYVRFSGDEATIGITNFAADQLGDVVFVELPEVGRVLKKGESFGVIESVKAVSDLYSPIGGTVVAINESLNDEPSMINEDSFGEGWIIKLQPANLEDAADALNPEQYQALIGA
ncbi:glycine cleavage system protein GcvH [bacterium]|nr:glycine cleavage system protein GcvH [bacterium]